MNISTETSKYPAGIQFVAQALGGALFGLALGGVAGLISARVFAGASNGWGDLIAAIISAMIGYTIGVSLGVYLIGRWLNRRDGISTRRRTYWFALLGGITGVALVLLAAEPLHLNQNTTVLQTFLFILPPIGATLGFNMRRRARR